MGRLFTAGAGALALALGLGGIMQAAPQSPSRAASAQSTRGAAPIDVATSIGGPQGGAPLGAAQGGAAGSARQLVFLELQREPAAVTYAAVLEQAAARTPQALTAAAAAGRNQIAAIDAEQQQVAAAITAAPFNATEVFRVRRAANGIAASVDGTALQALRRLPGVKAVYPIELEYPTNSTSVPFIGAPAVWSGAVGSGLPASGTGMRIAVIDTGVDYQHATFGGTGLLADYQANDRTAAPDAFYPSAKVVGGFDFAGDAYTGGAVVAPDDDPMDCNGHGTHVAATAAGYGVNTDSTTFAGPFGPSTPFASLRIGPGTAPNAQIYALRVFGCGGGTSLTIAAIDWAMDPNNDDDLSDHVDVINMSLGSSFGGLTSASALAADNAARAGVIVVASAGNSGDTYFIGGSPGSASRTISTAATTDTTAAGGLRVNAPAGVAGAYTAGPGNFGTPPPPAGTSGDVVAALDSTDPPGPLTTDACTPLLNAPGEMTGKIALIDRGNCDFDVKVKNAQDAGAIGAIVVHNAAGAPGGMAGDDLTVVIPSLMISQADGTTLRAQIPGLHVTLLPNGDLIGTFSSRGPRRGPGPIVLKPDIAAPGVAITSAQTGITCTGAAGSTGCLLVNATGTIPNSTPLVLQGTSMSAPHVTGIMALLRQLHPTWTVEELKALAMNRALHDVTTLAGGLGARFGPGRVGAGRVDAALAADSSVVAFNAEDPGLVSVSFDIPEVIGTRTQTRRIRVVNHGTTPQTYDAAIDTVIDAPGVIFSLPDGASVTVAPGQTIDLSVRVDATASEMDHVREAGVSATQAVASPGSLAGLQLARHWLTEESGYVTLSQSGTTRLRVPLYAATRPASVMNGPTTIITGGAPTGSTTIPLVGLDVCTGTLTAGPACTGALPDVTSLVSPFELQVVSPRNPALNAAQDLQYAGVAAESGRIWFGVSTWGDWSSPTEVSVNVHIDINADGTYDRIVANISSGTLARTYFGQTNQADTDVFMTTVFSPPNLFANIVAAGTPGWVNGQPPNAVDSALFNSNVMFFGATPAQLGLADTNAPFRYKIQTCPGTSAVCEPLHGFFLDEATGPYFWNGGAPGLNFSGITLHPDLNGNSLPVTWNTANLTTNGSLGALLLHHHNVAGQRAQVVVLDTSQRTDLGITLTALPPMPAPGENSTLTATVTHHGTGNATNVQAVVTLSPGLTFVSDDGGGALAADGTWTIGTLLGNESRTLQIVVTPGSAELMQARVVLSSGPMDVVAANNEAVVTFNALQTTDLQITAVPSPPSTIAGNAFGYTVTLTNTGAWPAHNVSIANTLTAGLGTIQTGTPSVGVFDAGSGLWNIATLGAGASATLNVSGVAAAGPTLTAQAQAFSGLPDPNTGNNVALASTTVTPRTATALLSAPAITVGGSSTVTILVTDTEATGAKSTPSGTVGFASSVPSDVFSLTTCGLAPVPLTTDQSSCSVTVTPATASLHTLTATYAGTGTHASQIATHDLAVDLLTTTLTAAGAAAVASPLAQNVALTATVASGAAVNEGTVTFTVRDVASAIVGVPVVSPTVAGGAAAATYVLPAGTVAQALSVTAEYSGGGLFGTSSGTSALTVDLRPTTTTAANATTVSSGEAQDVTLTANVSASAPVGDTVDEGTVTFSVRDAGSVIVGVPVTSAAPAGGAVSATFVLPAGTTAQTLSVTADYSGTGVLAASSDATKTLTVSAAPIDTLTYLLAEGATGLFFDLDILLVNPNNTAAPIRIDFLKEDGTTVTQERTLDPLTRTTIPVDDIAGLEGTALSTVVTSTQGLPLVVERTMRWDATGYGSHTEKATPGPAPTWYFAEGSQGFFSTFLLLANPDTAANTAHVTYFREGDTPLVRDYDLLPLSRRTISAGDDPGLVDRAFGIEVSFDRPGLVERATYFGASPIWSGGHASAGTTAPATQWFLAEGATGGFFATYVLLANPNADPAAVTMTYLPDAGDALVKAHTVPARGRTTIDIAGEDPTLAAAAVGVRVEADRPIIVERAQYWPQPAWIEGHSSAGLTEAGTRWGLAEGRVGGSHSDQTYVLLANASADEATVTITFLRASGAPIVKTFTVPAASRRNVAVTGAGGDVPELADESFGALIESTQPIVVERSVYSDAGGVTWAAGSNATGTRLPTGAAVISPEQ